MKCHYEVLSVPRDADDGAIKSAYKKLALKWHPDKNLENEEEAKEQFQLVQQAYEVLSDRQERAWYDNHREQILRGAGSEFQDNSLDVFQYFTTSCFKGYNDDEKGFYTTYRKVFETLAKEELEFIDDKEEFCDIPHFGDSKSDYETTVRPFYAYWLSFSTKKSYTWLDPYDIRETRERRVVKLIEKENKKVRQKAKKERNEEIRNLVAFVRKRDRRVQTQTKLEETRRLANRKKQEEFTKLKRLERNKQLNESTEQPEWAKFDNVKSELEQIEKNLAEQFGEDLSNSEEELEEDDNNIYCVACNKLFKKVKAFENHETSKKHKENVARLKESMLEEDDDYNNSSSRSVSEISICNEENDSEVVMTNIKTDDVSLSSDKDSCEEFELRTQKKKNAKKRNVLKTNLSEGEEDEVETIVRNDQSDPLLNKLTSDDDFDFNSASKQKKRSKKTNKNAKTKRAPSQNEPPSEFNTIEEEVTKKCKKDKKQKNTREVNEELDTNHCCVTCNSAFASKNKLFDHLKKTGHSVYLPCSSDKAGKSKQKLKK